MYVLQNFLYSLGVHQGLVDGSSISTGITFCFSSSSERTVLVKNITLRNNFTLLISSYLKGGKENESRMTTAWEMLHQLFSFHT
jgi:hypothetical protein